MDKIICIGKNYPDHAQELGDPQPAEPVLFLKPPSVLMNGGEGLLKRCLTAPLVRGRGALHYETEVVCKMKKGGLNINPESALSAIESVTLGLDMTLRDLQNSLKKQGHPWTISKVFPGSAIVGPWLPGHVWNTYQHKAFSLTLNGVQVQKAFPTDMLWSVAECIALASRSFEICPGDLLFTGTPCGVGSVSKHDEAILSWGEDISFSVRWE